MRRPSPPRFRGHTARAAKLRTIFAALACIALTSGTGLALFGALGAGSVTSRRLNATYTWVDDPLRFVGLLLPVALVGALFSIGAYAFLRRIEWRNWRH